MVPKLFLKNKNGFFSIAIALFLAFLFACSNVSQNEKIFFESPEFKNIYMKMVPEDPLTESNVQNFISQKKVIIGHFNENGINLPYENSMYNKIPQDNYGRFYNFLKVTGNLSFKEYLLPYERTNVPGITFMHLVRSFHKYSDNFKKYLSQNNNELICIIGNRILNKITYKNKYKQNVLGVEIPVISLNFVYSIKSNIPSLPSPAKNFEGRVKFYKDPDDGKWKIEEMNLSDSNVDEILTNLLSKNIKEYFDERWGTISNDQKIRRNEQLSKVYKKIFYVSPFQGGLGSMIIGLLTSDDAIEIEPYKGNYNMVEIIFDSIRSYGINPYSIYKPGQYVKMGDLGGTGHNWNTADRIFFDMQNYDQGKNEVIPYLSKVRINGSYDTVAKVTIYCVENSKEVNNYGLMNLKDKISFSCSDRY